MRLGTKVERAVVGDLGRGANWAAALAGVEVVVHLAARVHVMHDPVPDPLSVFRQVNVDGTLELAKQASASGVKRLVFLSSVKVNGEAGFFSESDPPAPQDAYAVSKHEAELGLRAIAGETGIEMVIIRAPLVYGPGVGANFHALMRAVARGIPLPFAAIDNRRSFVGLDNLVDFIRACIQHRAAANETFLVSDGEDLSTPDLIRRLASAMGVKARLFAVPPRLLLGMAMLLGKREAARRLLGSLQVDISKARRLMSWAPPETVDEGLERLIARS